MRKRKHRRYRRHLINPVTVIHGKRWGRRLADALKAPPAGVAAWMKRHGRTVKSDKTRLVGHLEIRGRPCLLKLYRSTSLTGRLLCLMHRGRAMRSYRTGMALAAAGVPVPRPRCCVLTGEGALVLSEGLSGEDYCRLWEKGPSREQTRSLMRAAGDTIAAAHAVGYTHGDCKWNNLLWSEETCFLVDMDGARRSLLGHPRRRARDIARFAVSAEEAGVPREMLDAFFDSYLRRSGEEREALLARMQPHLQKLRGRHEKQYGITPQPLV